jgi:hypothetical protein
MTASGVAREGASALRYAQIEKAVTKCMRQFLDLAGRNQLLYYQNLKRGTLELTSAEPNLPCGSCRDSHRSVTAGQSSEPLRRHEQA